MKTKMNFASDNFSPAHPQVIDFITRYNAGPAPAYGSDEVTLAARQKMKDVFGSHIEAFFVWNGTAANVLGLSAALKPHQSILCSDLAHILVDECGAPERFTGSKLVSIPSKNGKLDVSSLGAYFQRTGDQHASQPKVISISQSTEYGTLYTQPEIKALAKFAHEHDAYLHMDGARLSNAAAGLNLSFRELTTDAGVDLLSFGGTKNGLMGAEAVVLFRPELAENFSFIRKQGLHLSSKMRFLSAQFLAYFEGELWEKNASHANRMAQKLAEGLKSASSSIQITQPVQANVVFASMPAKMITTLQEEFYFYVWNASLNEVRLMCSFDTTETQVDQFIAKAKALG